METSKPTIAELISMVKSSTFSVSEIADKLEQVPEIAQLIINQSNSVALSLPRRIDNIRHAILVLGSNRLLAIFSRIHSNHATSAILRPRSPISEIRNPSIGGS